MAEHNWERLVRAALRRERLGAGGFGRPGSGIADNVPSCLGNRDIDAILRAADEIQEEDANVARICEFSSLLLYMGLLFLHYSFLQVSLIEFVAPWMSVSSFSLVLEFRFGSVL